MIKEDEYWDYFIRESKTNLKRSDLKKIVREMIIPNGSMLVYTRKLGRHFRLFILSNHVREWIDFLERKYKFMNIFEKTYFSFNYGVSKPDLSFYQILLDENNLDPQECIFIDDSEKNVKKAQGLGMNGIVFKDENSFLKEIGMRVDL